MRGLIASLVLFAACTPGNIKDERVNASGTANTIQTGSSNADAQGQSPGTPAAGNPNPALANFLPVAYTQDLEPSVKRLCTDTCHTGAPAQGTPLLNSAAALKAAATGAAAAIDSGRMPLDLATLGIGDKKYLAQLSISLKNWGKNDLYAADMSEFKVTYAAIESVAQGLCLGCHKGDAPPAGVRLDTIDAWKTNMPRILRAIEAGVMPPKIDEVQAPRLLNFLREWQSKNYPP